MAKTGEPFYPKPYNPGVSMADDTTAAVEVPPALNIPPASGSLSGNGSPVGVVTPDAGLLYIDNLTGNLWAVVNGAWFQEV